MKGYSVRYARNYSRRPDGTWKLHSSSIWDENGYTKTWPSVEAAEKAAEERKKENEKKPAKGRKKSKAEEEPELGEKDREYLAYKFFVELATKVTVMPIHPRSNMPIRSVEDYWQEELREAPVATLDMVKDILEMDSDDLDDVLEKWDELNKLGGE